MLKLCQDCNEQNGDEVGMENQEMKKLLFILNPRSGKGLIKNQLLEIIDCFQKNGYQVQVHITQFSFDAKETVKKIGKQFDRIVCSGGDGTLNETVSGMMEAGLHIPLGYVPSGSTNDFASSLKIPKKMNQAAEVAVCGDIFRCDIGSFNERYFNYVAAFGAFTEVSYATPQQMKNVLGHPAYIIEGMKQITTIKAAPMVVESDGNVVEGEFIFGMISNSTSVGGFKRLVGKTVLMDDGLFEVTFIKSPKNALELQEILNAILMEETNSEWLITFKTSSLRIYSPKSVPWVLDGEYGGNPSEIRVKNLRQVLAISSNSSFRCME